MSLTTTEAGELRKWLASLLFTMEEISIYISLIESTPEPPVIPAVPDTWPVAGTWTEKMAYTRLRAGVKSSTLRTVGLNGYVPEGCAWSASSKRLDVRTATLLENLYVPGTITPRDTSSTDVTLRNVLAQDVFAFESGGNRVKLIEDCTFEIPPERVVAGWGQGCLNAMRANFVVRRSTMRSGADGMQCSGGGILEECLIEFLTIAGVAPTGTHNDFIQNYSGIVNLRKCLFTQGLIAGQDSHLNGLFCDGGIYDVEDTAIVVTAPQGMNAFALHAAKAGHIDIRNSYVRGRIIGDVRQGSGVDILAGY